MHACLASLAPRLVVADVDAATRFYVAVFDATPGVRIETPDGHVVHAELDVAGVRISLTQSGADPDPRRLGGSPVVLALVCDDPDALQARAVEHGATVVHPVADRYYGMRDGRLEDPAGHLWLITQEREALSEEELNRRTAEQG